jgi:hypothetical protein
MNRIPSRLPARLASAGGSCFNSADEAGVFSAMTEN